MNNNNNNNDTNNTKISVLTWNVLASCYIFPESYKYVKKEVLKWSTLNIVGEIYLNSIDRDGTGQGYDFSSLEILGDYCNLPVILAGGVGNTKHLIDGLNHNFVDAVATANLFNFVGSGLQKAREKLQSEGFNLAKWKKNNERI